MSKGEHGTRVPCSTIANLTERSETSSAKHPLTKAPPGQGELSPKVTEGVVLRVVPLSS